MSLKTKTTLAQFGLAPSKKRGQNFLVHPATAQAIVNAAAFEPEDRVVEVGVGLGALTIPLARSVAQVIGLEIDRGIVEYHHKTGDLPDNVKLIHEDILKTDFSSLLDEDSNRLKIITNLPYSISNPFIFRLIDNRSLVESAVMLLQKEVVDRLCAEPGCKEYGIPTVLLRSCARLEKLMRIDAAQFHPRPKVDSQLIRIVFDTQPFPGSLSLVFKNTVRSAFAARRKTLLNNLLCAPSLLPSLAGDRQRRRTVLKEVIEASGLAPTLRAEAVSIEGFQNLAACLQEAEGADG